MGVVGELMYGSNIYSQYEGGGKLPGYRVYQDGKIIKEFGGIQMIKKFLLIILCTVIFFSNIILPIVFQYIDLVMICYLKVTQVSINQSYGIITYYLIIIPIILCLIYFFIKHKIKYLLILLSLKLVFMLTFTGIDNDFYHFFKEMPVFCIGEPALKTIK